MQKTIKTGCCGFPFKKAQYFKKLSVVELQSTFYRPPVRISTVEKWRRQTSGKAEFAVKAWQLITHPSSSPTYRKLRTDIPENKKGNYGFFRPTQQVHQAWEKIREVATILQAKIIIFQCPASFKPDEQNIENLKKFFKRVERGNFTFAWEPRGRWEAGLIRNLCRQLNLVHCTDPFKQKPVSGNINYFRLHGKPGYNLRYKYTPQDLTGLREMCDKHINYCMFNNLAMGQDAQKFNQMIQK